MLWDIPPGASFAKILDRIHDPHSYREAPRLRWIVGLRTNRQLDRSGSACLFAPKSWIRGNKAWEFRAAEPAATARSSHTTFCHRASCSSPEIAAMTAVTSGAKRMHAQRAYTMVMATRISHILSTNLAGCWPKRSIFVSSFENGLFDGGVF